QVLEVVASLRKLVDQGVACLARADDKGFRTIVDRNFELRTRICDVSEQDHEMIEIARSFGAAAKLCGSGGAVLCVPRSAGEFEPIEAAYLARGYSCIDPLRAPSERERK
ncbi:MAG: hypothetical protein NZ808_04745, partial [Myxococcota bacterium]|nr:hypothetical protein [Myxococcota bacterium]